MVVSSPIIYIIMPVHNRIKVTIKFISCLKKQTYTNYHLVLIDDGSTDGTGDIISKEIENITVLRGNGNLWWAGALQKGYKWLKNNKLKQEDYVLIINNDTEFDENYLRNGINIINKNDKILLVSRCYDKYSDKPIDVGITVDWRKLKFSQATNSNLINCLSTRGLFIMGKNFLELGGFHTFLLPHYGSDYEYTIRAFIRRFHLITSDQVRIWTDDSNKKNYHDLSISLKDYIKNQFSKKNPMNPFYFSIFIVLTCPRKFVLRNIIKLFNLSITGALSIIFRKFF